MMVLSKVSKMRSAKNCSMAPDDRFFLSKKRRQRTLNMKIPAQRKRKPSYNVSVPSALMLHTHKLSRPIQMSKKRRSWG